MGNHGSRRDSRRGRNSTGNANDVVCEGQAVHALKRVEEVRGPPVDSYDKLIAWLAEMADSDNVALDTSVFVRQLSSVCGSTPHSASATNLGLNGGDGSGSGSGVGSGVGGVGGGGVGPSAGARRNATLRQHSASCDSRASSSDTHRHSAARSTYSRSFDDALDPRHAWRQHTSFNSRQATFSDELEEDPDVRNASMESLYSGSDRDSEVEAMASTYNPPDLSATRRARFSLQREQQRDVRRPLLRQALMGSSTCSSTGETCRPAGGSFSEDGQAGRQSRDESGRSSVRGKYSSYGSCSSLRGSMVTLSSTVMASHLLLPCSASTGDLDMLSDALEEAAAEPQSPERVLARRRSVSLLNLTPPGRASYYVPDAAPPAELNPVKASHQSPPGAAMAAQMFLDDTLLDGNLADILFSVEALWPKK